MVWPSIQDHRQRLVVVSPKFSFIWNILPVSHYLGVSHVPVSSLGGRPSVWVVRFLLMRSRSSISVRRSQSTLSGTQLSGVPRGSFRCWLLGFSTGFSLLLVFCGEIIWDNVKFCSFSDFHLQLVASVDIFARISDNIVGYEMVIFLTSLFLLCDLLPSALLTYLCKYVLMDFCFIQWVIILCCHHFVGCSNFPRFGQWESFQTGFFIFCDLSPLFSEHLVIFWHNKMVQAYVLLFLLWLCDHPFLILAEKWSLETVWSSLCSLLL